MGNRFASGKWAIAQCDRCDGRYKLKELRREVIKGKNFDLLYVTTRELERAQPGEIKALKGWASNVKLVARLA